MKIGVCLIIKNENEYLEEWLTHYRSLGVDKFFIYDNNSTIPITSGGIRANCYPNSRTNTATGY